MKSKHNYLVYGILVLAIIGVIFLSGCTSKPKCPDCQSPGTWSTCTDNSIKTRTNYRCSTETNYICESYTEEKACAVEIRIKGTKDLDVVINPTLDEAVKGTIKIEALSVPEKTEEVDFFLVPQGIRLRANMLEEEAAKIEKGIDDNADGGWKYYLDTTKFGNGVYTIFIGSTYEGAPDENPWLDDASTQLVINN